MEEKKKVFIRGRKGCGKEIVKILKGLGAENTLKMGCNDENTIYFIDHKNRISCVLAGSETESIIMDNYREIKLPRHEWKDGDVLVCDKWPGQCAVFKKYREDDVFETYLTVDDGGISLNATAPVGIYHLASGKEFEIAAKVFYTVARKLLEVSNKLKR